ncbi:MAG: hypothetical protein HS115_03705 [Spirochaetales bacterium]|nr:hypothetical protein [Spirochaetales bacterium]
MPKSLIGLSTTTQFTASVDTEVAEGKHALMAYAKGGPGVAWSFQIADIDGTLFTLALAMAERGDHFRAQWRAGLELQAGLRFVLHDRFTLILRGFDRLYGAGQNVRITSGEVGMGLLFSSSWALEMSAETTLKSGYLREHQEVRAGLSYHF